MNIQKLRDKIRQRSEELNIQTRHTSEGHFYYIPEIDEVVGSVTGEHRHIKDPSLREFEKNEALRFFAAAVPELVLRAENGVGNLQAEIEMIVEKAKEAPILVRDNAGSKGNYIHDCRQEYFRRWIESGKLERPSGTIEDIAKARIDIPKEFELEVISATAGMDKFLDDTGYIPLGVEIPVYDAKDKVAGTLDEIGVINNELVLGDTKSSNQFKDTYTLQLMRYYKMFVRLFHLRPKRIFIVKPSKKNRTYEMEWFKPEQIKHGLRANHYLHKFNYHWEAIREERKPKAVELI